MNSHSFDADFFRQRIDTQLNHYLPHVQHSLVMAMRYASLQGGKRFRPLLVYAMGLSYGARLEELDFPAMAVEIIHAYSLVHDDLPAMDNDLLRRGKPTCHVAFGEALAILAGDAMQAFAFDILSQCPHRHTLTMIRLLARACGASGMAGGQAQDLAATGQAISEAQLQNIHREKTGELIAVSLILGALCSHAPSLSLDDLKQLGLELGLAYQIQDDIFDIELATEVRGKTQGADAQLNKATYPAILGIESAKQRLDQLIEKISIDLKNLNLTKSIFADLIHLIFTRRF